MKPTTWRWFLITLVAGLLIGITSRVEAGRAGGPLYASGTVGPYQSAAVSVMFHGGDVAVVMMVGGEGTDLELCVFDGHWNVATGDGVGNRQMVKVLVLRGGVFHIVVRNLGPYPNAFVLLTN
jgi:hypothetical protein